MYSPSAENAIEHTAPLCFCDRVDSCFLPTFCKLTMPSSIPEARYFPSGENISDSTEPLQCSVRSLAQFFDYRFQNFTVLSLLPEAKYLPSGENVTEFATQLCPFNDLIFFITVFLSNLNYVFPMTTKLRFIYSVFQCVNMLIFLFCFAIFYLIKYFTIFKYYMRKCDKNKSKIKYGISRWDETMKYIMVM